MFASGLRFPLQAFLLSSVVILCHAFRSDETFYSFEVTDIDGKNVSLNTYRGKVLLIVTVASECGFTEKHYTGLVRAKEILANGNFEILAFPCNQFGAQEPKESPDILKWAKENYKINFPLFQKLNVIEDDAHPLFKHLVKMSGQEIKWNFWKFLIDPEGHNVGAWGPWHDVEHIFPTIQHVVENIHQAPQPPSTSAEAGAPSGKKMSKKGGSTSGAPAGNRPRPPSTNKDSSEPPSGGAKPPSAKPSHDEV